MVRFLHTADWHLGMTRHFLGDEAQANFTAARFEAVRAIGEIAAREGCAFVVVCGDAFDSNQVDTRTVRRACDALAAIRVPVYVLPGNHDALDPGSVYRSRTFLESRPPNVRVLDTTGVHAVADGVELLAAPWPTRRPVQDLVGAVCSRVKPDRSVLRVAVGHGAVDTLAPSKDDPSLISVAEAERAISDGRIQYLALGDRHSSTDVGAAGKIRYAGAPEATDFDEVAAGGALIVEVDRDGASATDRRIGVWSFVRHEGHVNRDDDLESLRSHFAQVPRKDRTALRLALVGSLSVRQRAALDHLLDEERLVFASLELSSKRSDLVTLADDADFLDFGFTGFAKGAVVELRERAAGTGPEAQIAREALALLYRLARGQAS